MYKNEQSSTILDTLEIVRPQYISKLVHSRAKSKI